MIPDIFEYWLSTPTSGMPFCTWCQTILPLSTWLQTILPQLLISGMSEYLPNGTHNEPRFQPSLPEALKPATNEKPQQLLKTELFPLMNKGFSSVVDFIAFIHSTQTFSCYELYNIIQFVEIASLLKLYLCIMVMTSVTLTVRLYPGTVVRPERPKEVLGVLADSKGAQVSLSHMPMFRTQIHHRFLSMWRTKRTIRNMSVIAESDHLGDP